jgi:hypothetical protein
MKLLNPANWDALITENSMYFADKTNQLGFGLCLLDGMLLVMLILPTSEDKHLQIVQPINIIFN